MTLRRRDVEQWMSHRHLAEDLRRYHFSSFWSDLYLFLVFVKLIKFPTC